MKFVDFDIENYYQTQCSYEYLLITESDATGVYSRDIGRFCGKRTPPPFTTTSSQLNLYFVSDGSDQGRGFKIEYQFSSISGNFCNQMEIR